MFEERAKYDDGELLLDSPHRHVVLPLEFLGSPCKNLLLVAVRARIRNLVRSGHRWRNEPEGVAAHILVCKGLFNLRHITCDALSTTATGLVVRALFDCGRVRSVQRAGAMTFETH